MKGGRPRGSIGVPRSTKAQLVSKEMAREALRRLVLRDMRELVEAQISNAKGLKYLVTRDKGSGKFIKVGPAMASQVGAETIEVWEKEPSTPSFTDLMNRALDKPKEQPMEVDMYVSADIPARLAKGRQRAQLGESPIEMPGANVLEARNPGT